MIFVQTYKLTDHNSHKVKFTLYKLHNKQFRFKTTTGYNFISDLAGRDLHHLNRSSPLFGFWARERQVSFQDSSQTISSPSSSIGEETGGHNWVSKRFRPGFQLPIFYSCKSHLMGMKKMELLGWMRKCRSREFGYLGNEKNRHWGLEPTLAYSQIGYYKSHFEELHRQLLAPASVVVIN